MMIVIPLTEETAKAYIKGWINIFILVVSLIVTAIATFSFCDHIIQKETKTLVQSNQSNMTKTK